MKKYLLIILLPLILFTKANSQKTITPIKLAVSPGCNISKLKNDSAGTTNVANPQIGILVSKKLNKLIELNAAAQYSLRGATHIAPVYKFRNTYFDVQLFPQFSLADFLKIQLGCQYSHLLKSNLVIPNGNTGTVKKNMSAKYNSQLEYFLGVDFFLQKNASINLKYTLPLKSMEYDNFQITLNIFIIRSI